MERTVSIITCTKRHTCMETLFHNYGRQRYSNKELIVILNNNSLKIDEYTKAARKYKNVRIYSLPGEESLGHCLNYGVEWAYGDYIAKFDDDDYYAPGYLTDSLRIQLKTNADIVGKRAHYMYLGGKKVLLLRYPGKENQYTSLVQGATLLVKRKLFGQVKFQNLNRGECVKFCSDVLAKGFTIYSASKSNFLAIRRKQTKDHTWLASDKYLLTRNARILKVSDIRRYISKS